MRRNLYCEAHPSYQVKRKPRAACDRCLLLWYAKTLDGVLDTLYAMYGDDAKYPQLRLPKMQRERMLKAIKQIADASK